MKHKIKDWWGSRTLTNVHITDDNKTGLCGHLTTPRFRRIVDFEQAKTFCGPCMVVAMDRAETAIQSRDNLLDMVARLAQRSEAGQ